MEITDHKTAAAKELKQYTTPKLSKFGQVRLLTTGGSGMASEGEMGQAKPRP
jgi:hypothetical protein